MKKKIVLLFTLYKLEILLIKCCSVIDQIINRFAAINPSTVIFLNITFSKHIHNIMLLVWQRPKCNS